MVGIADEYDAIFGLVRLNEMAHASDASDRHHLILRCDVEAVISVVGARSKNTTPIAIPLAF